MGDYRLVAHCAVEDAPLLARNNMSAFYTATWWRALWTHKTLEQLIDATTRRAPHNLMTERHVRRHQKVVDPANGQIVGYARWILPESHAGEWLDAQAPDVSDQEKARFKRQFEETDFKARTDMDDLDPPVNDLKKKLAPEKFLKLDYLGVHPDYHRKGIASMLFRSGMEVADSLGLDIYFLAMGAKALGMYKKHGCEVLGECIQSLQPWGFDDVYDVYYMIKHPSRKPQDTSGEA